MYKPRGSLGESLAVIRKQGFVPATVIDVGVATGTPDLYATFPESQLLLVEPLEEYLPSLEAITSQYDASYCLAAASSAEGEIVIHVHDEHMDASSTLQEEMGREFDGRAKIVPTVRLDALIAERGLKGPFLLKVDVQGAELQVLDGCTGVLPELEVVVLEVSMFEFMKGAPQFVDVIKYMKDRGFVAYDILHGWYRPLDNALGQVDIVFVREDGRFRADHRFATPQQYWDLFGAS